MNSSSSSQLLQKLQNLYSGNKKTSEHSVSPLQPRPFACREINQLLEKSSPIPYLQVKKHDVEQWTERLIKPTEKASCSSFTQNENVFDIHLQKYSQISTISQSTLPVLMQIEKKVKLLKYAKENDHNTCAAIIAKMKLFCLDNAQTCYDFYRSTDLILLKYMIFLLIQELNQRPTIEKQEISNDQTSQFQSMVKDIVSIVYEIIEEIKQKSFGGSQIDKLNKQLTKIQNKFKPESNSAQKSINKSHHQRFSSCNFENSKTPISHNKSNKESNISSDKFKSSHQKQQNNVSGSQKIIKFQIDELEQKKQFINKLNEQISTLQNINKQQQVQIQDSNNQITSIKQELELKQQEIEKLLQSIEEFKSKDLIHQEEKEQYNTLFHEYENENIQLKQSLQQLQNAQEMCKTQLENYKQETFAFYQAQCNQIQQIKDKEITHLRNELKENQVNINHLLGDALYFGKQYKSLVDRIVNLKPESIANDLTQLQKELFYSENTLNAKLHAIANFSENLQFNIGSESLSQSSCSNQIGNLYGIPKSTMQQYGVNKKNCSQDYLISAQKNQFEIMEMLLIQSQVLEKFLI
ncbi:unnamed protein product [Paramecium primaurelia]|uniref:Uncharacterized protein n=1 Tax=Paramecium primaurelia TaxID=5886 RepID=A0A8S1PSM7_PARPR|nr:unnamed protein product [Paramecium primaurelia]